MRAIVLAGGQGTRLRSVINEVPKPMAPVAGRPFLAHLLDRLEGNGIDRVVLSVGYLKEPIVAAFGERYRGIEISYSIEEEPLGTGGGLRQALAMADAFPVFALNGDTIVDLDYAAMLRASEAAGAALTIALRRVPDAGRYGRAKVEGGRVVGFAARGEGTGPGLINAGVYLFARNVLDDPALPASFSFERDFLERRAATMRPLAFETSGYFIDIGVPEDYARAQRELAP
jgi:D-glycero-alpha-D-manno-heptose 1-phosphate guanylyltransferase